MTKEKTVSELLGQGTAFLEAHGIALPRREAELLLCVLLSCHRIDLYVEPARPIENDQEGLFQSYLTRRARREPIQYITGQVDFCGLSLSVRPGVFIPRPETELIVERARTITPAPCRILDLCTGSGALAIALAKQFPQSKIVATDIGETPLEIARANAKRLGSLHQIRFVLGDLLAPLRAESGRFDLIVCNPPYIPERDRPGLQPEVRDYEPELALFAPEEGTAFYRRILKGADSFLTTTGHLLLELGAGQAAWFQEYAGRESELSVTFVQDVAGIDRIAICRKRGSGG